MKKDFSKTEEKIRKLFGPTTLFKYKGQPYVVIKSGKPTCKNGEPKTDLYIQAEDGKGELHEFKISIKQLNADFLENKISAERAEEILGENWQIEISNATLQMRDKFDSKKLIYKSRRGNTREGSITVGWKFEFVNKASGELVGRLDLTKEQVIDIYSGTNLPQEKKDAYVVDSIIKNSGVAEYILFVGSNCDSVDEIMNSLIPIKDYVNDHPYVYFACKALNYRSKKNKYDGDRPLSVYVRWTVEDDMLKPEICYDKPLETRGNAVVQQLKESMDLIRVKNTDGIDDSKVTDSSKIFYGNT